MSENIIEQSVIEILQSRGWEYVNWKKISPEGLNCERETFEEVILTTRFRNALVKINPALPAHAIEAAIQKILRVYSPELLHNNEEFHRLLVEKIRIPYQENGFERSQEVALVDFENPLNNNSWLSINLPSLKRTRIKDLMYCCL